MEKWQTNMGKVDRNFSAKNETNYQPLGSEMN